MGTSRNQPSTRIRVALWSECRKHLLRAVVSFIAIAHTIALVVPAAAQVRADSKLGIRDCTEALRDEHNPGLVAGEDILVCFDGYISNFDSDDDDDGDGEPDLLGVPHWVVHHVRKAEGAAESRKRPSRWFTVPELEGKGLAPTHDSYTFSKGFRSSHADWYERGHLAQKYLVERIDNANNVSGKGAGYFTHNVVNAVPQRGRFNRGPWLDLECRTGAWANRFKEIWIITGPIFTSGRPSAWLLEPGREATPVAIPDAIFKIVARKVQRDDGSFRWGTLAFVYPQGHPKCREKTWDPNDWATSVARIEQLTGLEFFPQNSATENGNALSPLVRKKTERTSELWGHVPKDFDPGCKKFAREDE